MIRLFDDSWANEVSGTPFVGLFVPLGMQEISFHPTPTKIWMRRLPDDGPVRKWASIRVKDKIRINPGVYDIVLEPKGPYTVSMTSREKPDPVTLKKVGLMLYRRELREDETSWGKGDID